MKTKPIGKNKGDKRLLFSLKEIEISMGSSASAPVAPNASAAPNVPAAAPNVPAAAVNAEKKNGNKTVTTAPVQGATQGGRRKKSKTNKRKTNKRRKH
jgi:hypothetical protein